MSLIDTPVPPLLLPSLERAQQRGELDRVFSYPSNVEKCARMAGIVVASAAVAAKYVFHDRAADQAEMEAMIDITTAMLDAGTYRLPEPMVWLEVYRDDSDCRLAIFAEEMQQPSAGGPVIRLTTFTYSDYWQELSPWVYINLTAEMPLRDRTGSMYVQHEPGVPPEAQDEIRKLMEGTATALRAFLLALAHPDAGELIEPVPRQRNRRPTGPRYSHAYTVVESPADYRLIDPAAVAVAPGAVEPVIAPAGQTLH